MTAEEALRNLLALIELDADRNKANHATIMLEEPEVIDARSVLLALDSERRPIDPTIAAEDAA